MREIFGDSIVELTADDYTTYRDGVEILTAYADRCRHRQEDDYEELEWAYFTATVDASAPKPKPVYGHGGFKKIVC